jgi:putative transposase
MTGFDMIKLITDLKKQEEFAWLKEVNSQALQQAIVHLDKAYKNAFASSFGFPKFKSKHNHRDSYTSPQKFRLSFEDSTITLPKFKEPIKIRVDREFEGKLCSATVKRVPSGKYFVSILVDDGMSEPKATTIKSLDGVLGVDLGLKDFIIDSNGHKVVPLNAFRKNEGLLKKVQQDHSKKKNGSKNKEKARVKVARVHEHITNVRKDFLHKLSTKLVSENQAISLESLKVKNMIKNHCLAKSIADASWSTFTSMLEYKARWNGKTVVRLDTYYPSSKLCSDCGWKKKDLKLSDREWVCEGCGVVHDRDVNAARNIQTQGWYLLEKTNLQKSEQNISNICSVGLEEPESTPTESRISSEAANAAKPSSDVEVGKSTVFSR